MSAFGLVGRNPAVAVGDDRHYEIRGGGKAGRHWRAGVSRAGQSSLIWARKPQARAASAALSRHGRRSATVEEIKTVGAVPSSERCTTLYRPRPSAWFRLDPRDLWNGGKQRGTQRRWRRKHETYLCMISPAAIQRARLPSGASESTLVSATNRRTFSGVVSAMREGAVRPFSNLKAAADVRILPRRPLPGSDFRALFNEFFHSLFSSMAVCGPRLGPVRGGERCSAYRCGDAASRDRELCPRGPEERPQRQSSCPAAARMK